MSISEEKFSAPWGASQTTSILPNKPLVAISGLGCVTCLGVDSHSLWDSVMGEKTGIQEGVGCVNIDQIRSTLPPNVDYAAVFREVESSLPKSRLEYFTLYAMSQAMKSAGWDQLKDTDGIILGTTTGDILFWEYEMVAFSRNEENALSRYFHHEPLSRPLDWICEKIGFHGPRSVVTSACSSSIHAIALGCLWVATGKVKRCLVGGSEVLCRLTLEGFKSLQLLGDRPATPFDRNRQGINLAEGSAFFCLERREKCRTPLALVSGFGLASDAYHMTAPHPEGRGCYDAIQMALIKSGLKKKDISWVHAHGTGSVANDLSEGAALDQVFGDDGPWVSSTKGIHGHALAASGAIETVICLKALETGWIPHTTGLSDPDSKIKVKHPRECMNIRPQHILKTSLGFGGANAALILSHPRSYL